MNKKITILSGIVFAGGLISSLITKAMMNKEIRDLKESLKK